MNKEVKEFRDGIFSLKTRRFGKIAELMIQKLYNYNDSKTVAYDLLSKKDEKIEVKFSTVLKKNNSIIKSDNLLESVISCSLENRMLSYNEAKNNPFDCNIQQIKSKEFKYLYYGCFFSDKIMICRITKDQIKEDKKIFYSDHQHRGNTGEGQFHINKYSLDHHLNNYLIKFLSYEELYNLFK